MSSCDGNRCSTTANGFCAYQQITDANGNTVSTIRSCLNTNVVVAGPFYITQPGQCIETVDPSTDMTYRTYLCNSHNYCNADCHEDLSSTVTEMLNVSIRGLRSIHYSMQCINIPVAKTPDGNSITEINKCIASTDILGNHFYTLICNETNLCNAKCNLAPTILPIPVVPHSSTSKYSATFTLHLFFLAILIAHFVT
uniref:Uncharacterized protein n=1 Tax=Setaria digitata TaxID=48799 RepID=A0A915Q7H4_9BILA